MKTFKTICAAMVLAVLLSIPAFADTNPNDVHEPGRSTTKSMTTSVDSGSVESATTVDSYDSFSAFADTLWAFALLF
jgi:hypothetical protein